MLAMRHFLYSAAVGVAKLTPRRARHGHHAICMPARHAYECLILLHRLRITSRRDSKKEILDAY